MLHHTYGRLSRMQLFPLIGEPGQIDLTKLLQRNKIFWDVPILLFLLISHLALRSNLHDVWRKSRALIVTCPVRSVTQKSAADDNGGTGDLEERPLYSYLEF